MSFFMSSTPAVVPEQKVALNPILSRKQLGVAAADLPYALPALISEVSSRAKGKGKKGNRNGGVKSYVYRFPTPAETSNLNKVYDVVQTLLGTVVTSSISVPTYTSQYFRLSDFDNGGNFATVFDQYRISMLEVTYEPVFNVSAATGDPGRFVSVVDLDNATNVTSVNNALDYPGAIVTQGMEKFHRHTFVPHCAVAAYSGTFTSYMNVEAPWIDSATQGVQHYGVKTAWSVTSYINTYSTIVRAHLQFRNVM
jgi:hypothetical protein